LAPEPILTWWWREKFPTPVGIRTPIVQPVAYSMLVETERPFKAGVRGMGASHGI